MPVASLFAPARTRSRFALQVAILAAACFGAAEFSTAISALHGPLPPFWLPAGVGLAGLLLLGVRAWPAVAIASFAANVGVAELPGVLLIAAGNTLGAALPAWLIRWRAAGPPALEQLGDVIRLLGFGALLGPAIASAVGFLGLRVGASHHSVDDLVLVCTWFSGCVTGVVVFAPLLLAWLGPRPASPLPGRRIEALVLLTGLVGTSALTGLVTPVYILLAFPLFTWAALRFGARGTTLLTLGLLGMSVMAAQANHASWVGTVLSVRLYFAAVHFSYVATGLLLAASTAERQQARMVERAVDDAYRALIAASPLAIIGLDLEARVTVWSRAAGQLFGWTAEEIRGQPLPTIPPEREQEFQSLLAEHVRPVSGLETVRRRKDGRLVNVLLSTWPLYDAEGCLSGGMIAEQDITDRKAAQQLQESTYRISHAALTAADLGQLYVAIHRIVSELMPAQNFYIAHYDAGTDTLSFPYWVDEHDPAPAPRRCRKGLTEYVLRTGARSATGRPISARSSLGARWSHSAAPHRTGWVCRWWSPGGRSGCSPCRATTGRCDIPRESRGFSSSFPARWRWRSSASAQRTPCARRSGNSARCSQRCGTSSSSSIGRGAT